ncbi:MAG: NUDIX hydrolase [Candidatus Schekmanbacteria bacterium]|nr:MAG: NUDIX hydrolase [Candidatus Schekmanbacteria bacterium]
MECPNCGTKVRDFKNPVPTVDIIIEVEEEGKKKIVLIKRKNPPYGWAIPGGYVDYGESLEDCAIREAKEETSLDVELIRQFHAYSDPSRDERQHNISIVFIAKKKGGRLSASSDAEDAQLFDEMTLPDEIAFDHKKILEDYFEDKY